MFKIVYTVVVVMVERKQEREKMLKYANQYGYSDVNPYEVVREVSGKTLEVRAMEVERS